MTNLRGKTLGQRTKALIGLAHPKFRDKLLFEAKKRNIII
ncbi:acetyl-CoA hydrolase/transferase C-terminal domain-containing protein [Oceanobacillus sp. HCA-5259]